LVILSLSAHFDTDQRFVLAFFNRLRVTGIPAVSFQLNIDWTNATASEPLAQAIRDTLSSSAYLDRFVFDESARETSPVGLDTMLSGLYDHTTIRELGFYTNGTENNVGTMHYVNLLRRNNILDLLMSCNDVNGVCEVVGSIVDDFNTTLKDLTCLVHNPVNVEFWKEGVRQLGALLPRVRYLKALTLDFCVDDEDTPEMDLILPFLLAGFRDNKSLTQVSVDILRFTDAEKTINFYCARNEFGPCLANTPGNKLFLMSHRLLQRNRTPEEGLSVVYEALRWRDDWFKKISTDSGSRRK